jgi:4'-phosphopantetheinyl transferase
VRVANDKLELCDDEVHLWLVYDDEIHDSLLEDYRRVLSHDERLKERRFQFAAERRRHVVTRTLVRTVLSKYADVPPEEWCFRPNAYGRPEIDAEISAAPGLSFNVSHSKGLIICGVTRARAIGVDVENERGNKAPLNVARYFFSASEAAALDALPLASRSSRFFEYWTLKESYIKAVGKGLTVPLDQFSFDLEAPGRVGLRFHPPLDDDPARWKFWLFKPSSAHVVAVCVQHAVGDREPKFRVAETVPVVGAAVDDLGRREPSMHAREVRLHPAWSRDSRARDARIDLARA